MGIRFDSDLADAVDDQRALIDQLKQELAQAQKRAAEWEDEAGKLREALCAVLPYAESRAEDIDEEAQEVSTTSAHLASSKALSALERARVALRPASGSGEGVAT